MITVTSNIAIQGISMNTGGTAFTAPLLCGGVQEGAGSFKFLISVVISSIN